MLDTCVSGPVERLSPEAGVPVVRVDSERSAPGGAANVAMNLSSLGASVALCGVAGQDRTWDDLAAILTREGVDIASVTSCSQRQTTHKMRLSSRGLPMARLDFEASEPIGPDLEEALLGSVYGAVSAGVDGIVLSDYAKGVCTPRVCRSVIHMARQFGMPVVVDPKDGSFAKYRGATSLCPNLDEFDGVMHGDESVPEMRAARMVRELELDFLVVTMGSGGVFLSDGDEVERFPARAQTVCDVAGAGDTVAAVMALGLASGWSFREAVVLANVAAGVVVGKPGAATLTVEELQEALTDGSDEIGRSWVDASNRFVGR